MHRACRKQARNRRMLFINASVAQDQKARPRIDCTLASRAQGHKRLLEDRAWVGAPRIEQHRENGDPEIGERLRENLRKLLAGQHGLLQLQEPALLGSLHQEIPLATQATPESHHEFLANRVDGRVGHLSKLLLEIAKQRVGALAEDGKRRVCAHAADRLLAARSHRREQDAQVLARVAEGSQKAPPLFGRHRRGSRHIGQGAKLNLVGLEPLRVRLLGCYLVFDLVVAHDPAAREIDEEHAPWLKAPLLDDVLGFKIQNPELACGNHVAARGDHVLHRPQAIAVERGSEVHAVGKEERRRTVPRLDER